jgi:hypothetical protein
MVDETIVTEQFIQFPFLYITPTEIVVEETNTEKATIKGVLLREGMSSNGNLYTIEEMESIAKQAENIPMYLGARPKYDPNLGIVKQNAHANDDDNKIGKIINAVFSAKERLIRFVAEIYNTVKFPTLVEEVKSGWGVSIGGIATKAKLMINELGKMITKVMGMQLNHVQLLSPTIKLGQDEARIDGVEIQETMQFDFNVNDIDNNSSDEETHYNDLDDTIITINFKW